MPLTVHSDGHDRALDSDSGWLLHVPTLEILAAGKGSGMEMTNLETVFIQQKHPTDTCAYG